METTPDETRIPMLNGVDVIEPETKSKIQVRGLTRVSDTGVPILNGVSVDIPKGVIVGIIGPSGSGKSTLLRALNRLWEPPAGTVLLDGRDICDLDVLTLRRKVGMLFQLPVLFDGTVADNIRYGPQLRGKKLSDTEVSKLLNLADLDSSFATKAGGELSVGQAQRVALARTLANDPKFEESPIIICYCFHLLFPIHGCGVLWVEFLWEEIWKLSLILLPQISGNDCFSDSLSFSILGSKSQCPNTPIQPAVHI
ncbi:PREDICTED: ABC transporter I family member 17 isoform X2 [Nelumbo nucifera]|uniref:ABC transporter I family member 17 isoform X2 n=2 Tax=Nelumbo nucifera TaxID=4432 RepID=A0A1U8AEI5_NELNU|nr:PREDICTED: ABC transporter I family member 17 isoform X2 [Nelumbo nucifera]DAD45678.1 TPA_asm: hypothetical protein HUJ06_003908 [Nelumbo nucifera]